MVINPLKVSSRWLSSSTCRCKCDQQCPEVLITSRLLGPSWLEILSLFPKSRSSWAEIFTRTLRLRSRWACYHQFRTNLHYDRERAPPIARPLTSTHTKYQFITREFNFRSNTRKIAKMSFLGLLVIVSPIQS